MENILEKVVSSEGVGIKWSKRIGTSEDRTLG